MREIVGDCELIIAELKKFNNAMVYLGPAITDDRLTMLEDQIGFTLPLDLKYLLHKHNGFSLDGTEVYGLGAALRGSSLDRVYEFEHLATAYKMPDNFLPFSPDGRGNHYCLVLTTQTDVCPVAFWQHDLNYDINEVEICNDSFIDWVNEVLIDWTLDGYNYDGTEKKSNVMLV